ncbi:MAG TPA: type IX secretion system outer membrane channel protein PorV [Bacteroidia bacterium]|nr:type IX secretion system outer membrane channel protein PorV [Bacteroidia bacterium]
MRFLREKKIFTLTAGFAFGCSGFLYAQSSSSNFNNIGQATSGKNINTITTAVPFLTIAPDSRSGGMGDAGVASSPDASSLDWNCSKLAFIDKKMGFTVSYTPWLRALVPDINLAYISGYYKLKNDQAISASLRYFSLGSITFTNAAGNATGQFNPNEFALDFGYAKKLSDRWSGGMAMRYIYSNLTGGQTVASGQTTHPGRSIAADINAFYQNSDITISGKKSILRAGINISNIGAKMSYSSSTETDFIPTDLRLGSSFTIKTDQYNSFTFMVDASKLLVPTPPVYYQSKKTGTDSVNANGYVILAGKDPNVGVVTGMMQSFYDAPGGALEEFHQIDWSFGTEYWYNQEFAIRLGYFYENKYEGDRQYVTLGAGLKYEVFSLDLAYLIPTQINNPLAHTLRFTMNFDMDAFKNQNKKDASATN